MIARPELEAHGVAIGNETAFTFWKGQTAAPSWAHPAVYEAARFGRFETGCLFV